MVEPASLLVSALIALTVKTASKCQDYIRSIRNAPNTVSTIMEHVSAFHPSLQVVINILDEPNGDADILRKALEEHVLKGAKDCLEQLYQLVQRLPQDPSLPKHHRVFLRIKWPMESETKAQDLLARLQMYREHVKMALAVDSM
jgi:hypothetical protein